MGPPRLLVFGGNGYVGTRVCKEALDTGLGVVSISRSGQPPVQDSWVPQVEWVEVGHNAYHPMQAWSRKPEVVEVSHLLGRDCGPCAVGIC